MGLCAYISTLSSEHHNDCCHSFHLQQQVAIALKQAHVSVQKLHVKTREERLQLNIEVQLTKLIVLCFILTCTDASRVTETI